MFLMLCILHKLSFLVPVHPPRCGGLSFYTVADGHPNFSASAEISFLARMSSSRASSSRSSSAGDSRWELRKLGSAEFERDSQSGIRGQSRFLHGRISSPRLSFLRLAARCCQHSADILWSERILPAVIGVSNGASRPLFSTKSAAARDPARQQPSADLLLPGRLPPAAAPVRRSGGGA